MEKKEGSGFLGLSKHLKSELEPMGRAKRDYNIEEGGGKQHFLPEPHSWLERGGSNLQSTATRGDCRGLHGEMREWNGALATVGCSVK